MSSTAWRLLFVAILAVGVHKGVDWARHGLLPPRVEMPDRDYNDLPLELGEWQGKEAKLDAKIFERLGAKVAIDRVYHSSAGEEVTAHLAIFDEYDVGALHRPYNCYRSSGWQLVDDSYPVLHVGDKQIKVSQSVWDREGERVVVLYWYQLGEHIFTERLSLGWIRFQLRDAPVWPPLVKVLLQTNADRMEQASLRLESLGQSIYTWVNEPQETTSPPEKTAPEPEDSSAEKTALPDAVGLPPQ